MCHKKIMSTSDTPNDGDRAQTAVVASLRILPNGRTQLIFDDVSAMPMLDATAWTQERLYTIAEFDSAAFEKLELSESDFIQIAENLIIRLSVLRKSGRLQSAGSVASSPLSISLCDIRGVNDDALAIHGVCEICLYRTGSSIALSTRRPI
jgi:hypothetical protein